jgi:PHD/YefM family antitoxin component YafN of YafNO toxin-antitoxin module
MTIITANELKTKGVSNIEKLLAAESEVVISVHGQPKYVVMEIEQYEVLREHELEAAWRRVKEDVAEGRYRAESADEHMARISDEPSDEL